MPAPDPVEPDIDPPARAAWPDVDPTTLAPGELVIVGPDGVPSSVPSPTALTGTA